MQERLKGLLFCFFAVLCWSFSEITVRLLKSSSSCGPITLSFFRFFLGGLFLFGIIVAKGSLEGTWYFLKRNWVLFTLSSVFALGISNMIYFLALQFVQANIGSALYTTYPIFISIYGIFILDERSSLKRKALGYAIGFFGTFILLVNVNFSLIFNPAAFGSDLITKFSALFDLSNVGNVMLVVAAALWGFYSVLGKKISLLNPDTRDSQLKFSAFSNLLACIPNFIVILFMPSGSPNSIDLLFVHLPSEWILILIMGFIITGLAYYAFFIGVKKIEVTKGISLSLLKPVLVTIFSLVILSNEAVPSALFVSIPLISAAVLFINTQGKKPDVTHTQAILVKNLPESR